MKLNKEFAMTIVQRRYEKLLEARREVGISIKIDASLDERIISNEILLKIANINPSSRNELKLVVDRTTLKRNTFWVIKTLLNSEEEIIIDDYLDSYPDLTAS